MMAVRQENEPTPPAAFRQASTSTLELRESSGWMAVLGVPFFLVGAFMALSLGGILPYEATPERDWGPLVLGVMSILFLGLGSVLLFGRRWLTLDLSRGSVVRQQGLLIPMRSEERHLSEFTAVVIAFDSGNSSESPDRYPVRLRAMKGKDFVISSPAQFSESRKQAEYLSRFLLLPLADAISDHETIVGPEKAGDSLRDRLLSGEAQAERLIQPPGLLCQVTESADDATINIPGPRFMMSGLVGILVPAGVFLVAIPVFVGFFLRNGSTGSVVAALLISLLVLGIPSIFVGANLMVEGSRKRTTVKASPAGLVIERRGVWRTQTTVVQASDILDVDQSTLEGASKPNRNSFVMTAPPDTASNRILAALKKWAQNKGIVVKSRQELITFGEGLPADELQYLIWVLKKALVGR